MWLACCDSQIGHKIGDHSIHEWVRAIQKCHAYLGNTVSVHQGHIGSWLVLWFPTEKDLETASWLSQDAVAVGLGFFLPLPPPLSFAVYLILLVFLVHTAHETGWNIEIITICMLYPVPGYWRAATFKSYIHDDSSQQIWPEMRCRLNCYSRYSCWYSLHSYSTWLRARPFGSVIVLASVIRMTFEFVHTPESCSIHCSFCRGGNLLLLCVAWSDELYDRRWHYAMTSLCTRSTSTSSRSSSSSSRCYKDQHGLRFWVYSKLENWISSSCNWNWNFSFSIWIITI